MKYLGIDYGGKRIGLAVSTAGIAFPRGVIANDSTTLAELVHIVQKERITHIVAGDTRSFGGKANPITEEADAFFERLERETNIPVIRAFEAGSSVEASRHSESGEKHDDAAAALILQRYLDMNADTIDSNHA